MTSEGFKHIAKGRWPILVNLNFGLIYSLSKYENRMQMSCWEFISQYQFLQLKYLDLPENQPICCIHCLLAQAKLIRILDGKFNIKNKFMD